MTTESSQKDLKRRHESLVFHLIRKRAPLSRVELAAESGLSAQTITNIVRRLMDAGIVAEVGAASSGHVGRSPVNLDLIGEGAYAFGFCIERDQLSHVLINVKGDIIDSRSEAIDSCELPEDAVGRMAAYAQSVMGCSEYAPIRDSIVGAGIAAPGPVDLERGEVIAPPNFANWPRVPLRAALERELHMPVVMGNSSTMAAIGEQWRGRWDDSFLYVHWGLGIGGGLVHNDTVYRGQSGNEIELGHMVIERNGRRCGCGGYGCLEAYASVPAILEEAAAYGYATLDNLAAAASTDTIAHHLLARAADAVANCLVSAVNLLDVNMIVLGGRHVPALEPTVVPIIREYVNTRCIRSGVAPVRVAVSPLGEQAGAIGAASQVFHEGLLAHVFPTS